MRFWFFSAGADPSERRRRLAPPVRLVLESLEDRCLPSASMMPASAPGTPSTPSPTSAAVNAIASLSHDQIHMLQDQSQTQTTLATIRLVEEQAVLGILNAFAPQAPQFQPLIAFLKSDIPAQQAMVSSLQNQTNLLNQLDDLQDQSLILSADIQTGTALVSALQQVGAIPAANAVKNIVAADQMAMTALQPQIAAVEAEVATFI